MQGAEHMKLCRELFAAFSDDDSYKPTPPLMKLDINAFISSNAFQQRPAESTTASRLVSSRSAFNEAWIPARYSFEGSQRKQRHRARGPVLAVDSKQASEIQILSLTDSWVAVNKPPGMLVHRTKLYHSNPNETYLVDHVSRLVAERKGSPIAVRPVQRLDRPTSGVMLFGLGDSSSAARLQAALQSADSQKRYWAIVSGADMPEQWVNEHPLTDLTGKNRKQRSARTEIQQIMRLRASDVSIVSARIHTGRRHQIRRHLSNSRHPILGDTSYGKGETNRKAREQFGVTRCCLHAWRLTFKDPETNNMLDFEVAIPDDLRNVLCQFRDFDSTHIESAWKVT